MGYYLYKGLKKPLVFFGLKGKYIFYAVGVVGAGVVAALILSKFGLLGSLLGLAVTAGGVYLIFRRQDKNGLYDKTKNFDQVMNDLVYGDGRKAPDQSHVDILNLVMRHKSKIMVKHIPIPSKIAFVIEESAGRQWADKTMNLAINAIRRMQETEEAIDTLKLKAIESRTSKILDSLGEFYYEFLKKNWDGKTKIFRKHVFGARLHFTARAVITSLTLNHNKSELHFPWAMSLQLFKIHIASKLIRRGYSAEEAQALINGHAYRYHPVLDAIFRELIEESPYMGIPVIFQRNPSLSRASAQLLYVTRVKTNPADNTIGVSTLVISGSNADTRYYTIKYD